MFAHNERLTDRENSLVSLKKEFWEVMRWQYDQTITRHDLDKKQTKEKLQAAHDRIIGIESRIKELRSQVEVAQKNTVNIESAIEAINNGLIEIGIDDFYITKHNESLYRIVRAGDDADAFNTLSEGEKMMISFLYFCELCKGKSSAQDSSAQKIVVIDDPISSMSHIFVFNIGRLIHSQFFRNTNIAQVFVLTHNLYFFYELTDTNKDRRKENQNLFRISKSPSGSSIRKMKYEEIQNDYHAYWSIINDADQPAALVANCMRNIVEYFFGFVRKRDFNAVFQIAELQETSMQSFSRYMNRESHSMGQNIFDVKEFDYDMFRSGLQIVFEKTDYSDHFKEMSKI